MKILVLDDNEIIRSAPADYFVNAHDYRTDNFTQTRYVEEFLILLYSHNDWDEVWMDHDLGNPDENGMIAVKAILENLYVFKRKVPGSPLFVITTMNPAISNRMYDDLASVVHVIRKSMSSLGDFGISRGNYIPLSQKEGTKEEAYE